MEDKKKLLQRALAGLYAVLADGDVERHLYPDEVKTIERAISMLCALEERGK